MEKAGASAPAFLFARRLHRSRVGWTTSFPAILEWIGRKAIPARQPSFESTIASVCCPRTKFTSVIPSNPRN